MASGCKLFVGCLPYSKTEQDIYDVFAQCGPVEEVIMMRRPDGMPKGAAFVTYEDPESAERALERLKDYLFPGSSRAINLSMASSDGPSNKSSFATPPPPPPGGTSVYFPPPGKELAPGAPPPPLANGAGKASAGAPPPPPPGAGKGRYGHPPPPPAPPSAGPPPPPEPPLSIAKLFVGQLPFSRTEQDLWDAFSAFGQVAEVIMLKDTRTGEKKGAAFVKMSAEDAQLAVDGLNGYLFDGATRNITVSFATSQDNGRGVGHPNPPAPPPAPPPGPPSPLKRSHSSLGNAPPPPPPVNHHVPTGVWLGNGQHPVVHHVGRAGAPPPPPGNPEASSSAKLFVGQLPFSRTEEDLFQLFSTYGPVAEVFLHRDAQGQKKGAAFVRYFADEHAEAALVLDGYIFDGATRSITVALAESSAKRRRM